MENKLPLHFWQIHKKVYNREWTTLDRSVRKEIARDYEGPTAKKFFEHVSRVATTMFEDPNSGYNSVYRFKYNP